MRASRVTLMNNGVNPVVLEEMRAAQKVETLRPFVQRYELDKRIQRLEDIAESLRVEWRRCWLQSAGIAPQIDEINAAGNGLKNHIAHLKMLRDALPQ